MLHASEYSYFTSKGSFLVPCGDQICLYNGLIPSVNGAYLEPNDRRG